MTFYKNLIGGGRAFSNRDIPHSESAVKSLEDKHFRSSYGAWVELSGNSTCPETDHHFRVPKTLTLKTGPSAKSFL